MAKHKGQQEAVQAILRAFAVLDWRLKLAVVALVGVGLLVWYLTGGGTPAPPTLPGTSPDLGKPSPELLQRDEYLFCWWNLENFFDDRNDQRRTQGDEVPDSWFADNPGILAEKVNNLASVLLKMNRGSGPDILACGEVEEPSSGDAPRALLLLRDRLNAAIGDPGLRYREILWKKMAGGRAIINAILTRLPVEPARTRLIHGTDRSLEGVIRVRDHDLTIIATHWTSRLTDHTGEKRAKYADNIAARYRELYQRDRNVALLIAGDLNDSPKDLSVAAHLNATGDMGRVLRASAEPPPLLNLMLHPRLGDQCTCGEGSKRIVFDQIIAAPGLLRPGPQGWTVEPDTITIVTEDVAHRKRGSPYLTPFRFGGPRDEGARGYSDHLPVTVTLRLPR